MFDYQSYLRVIKKVAKFLWRHCLTLFDIYLSISVFFEEGLNWKNAILCTMAAVFLDWAKQFIKLTPNPHTRSSFSESPRHDYSSYSYRWWDTSYTGSSQSSDRY